MGRKKDATVLVAKDGSRKPRVEDKKPRPQQQQQQQ